jgi:hypothetical protein
MEQQTDRHSSPFLMQLHQESNWLNRHADVHVLKKTLYPRTQPIQWYLTSDFEQQTIQFLRPLIPSMEHPVPPQLTLIRSLHPS